MKGEVTFYLSFFRIERELFLHICKSIRRYVNDRIVPDIKAVVGYWIWHLLNTHLMIIEEN